MDLKINKYFNKFLSLLSIAFFIFIFLSFFILSDANEVISSEIFKRPSFIHIFGTDQFGRDVFIRTVIGFRYTFLLSLLTMIISFPVGIYLGILLGYYGGIFDEIFYYFANMFLSFPMIILAIVLGAYTNANIFALLGLIIVYIIIANSKIVRSEIKVIKNEDYIRNLKVLGVSGFTIIKDHLLAKSFRIIMPNFPLLMGHIIISISTFSFIGYGVKPPNPEIGTMLSDSLRFIDRAYWLMIFPGLFQFFAILLIMNLSKHINNLYFKKRNYYE